MTFHDIFPLGATVTILGESFTVHRLIDDVPAVVLVNDALGVMTVNPKWLAKIASGVKFPEVAA